MGKLNIKEKAKKVAAKLKNSQNLRVPMKAKTVKTEAKQTLLTPNMKSSGSSVIRSRTKKLTNTVSGRGAKSPKVKLLLNADDDSDDDDNNDKTNDDNNKVHKGDVGKVNIVKTKKQKLKEKHANLMNKFALIKKQTIEEKERKKRAKTVITGDLNTLKDALPSLHEVLELSKKRNEVKTSGNEDGKSSKKLSAKKKLKKKKAKFMGQVKSYEALLKDVDFKKNPREAIAFHIKYTHGLIDE